MTLTLNSREKVSAGPAFLRNGRSSQKNAGWLVAAAAGAGLAGSAGTILAAGIVAAGRRWSTADDPCDGHTLDLDGAETFKVERPDGAVIDGVVVGSGTTVVLSHCWTGTRATWEAVAARLVAADRRVVLYDQRGHGASTAGPDTPTVEHLGHDLAGVLETVDARDAVLAGHSMGGMAVQALAAARPDVLGERVRALVLAGTAAAGVAAGRFAGPARFATVNPRIERLLAGRAGVALVRGTVGRSPRRAHLVATRDAFLSLPAGNRLEFLAAIQATDLREGLGAIPVPTTVVVGSRDLLTPPRQARTIARSIPAARLVEVPGAGHMLPYEEPECLAQLILSAGAEPRLAEPRRHGGAS